MGRIEILIIKSFLWIFIPFAVFILFWWTSYILTIYNFFSLTENQIAYIAISGLVIGLFLVFSTKKILLSNFYYIQNWILILIYLFYSVVAFASMMGLPLGNLVLGGIAGFYIGRKIKYNKLNPQIHFKKTCLFTTIVTGFWVLVICMLVLNESEVFLFFERNFQLTQGIVVVPILILIIISTILIMGVLQFYLTRFTCRLSFK